MINHESASEGKPDVKLPYPLDPTKNRAGTLNEQLSFWKGQKRKPIKGVSCLLQC